MIMSLRNVPIRWLLLALSWPILAAGAAGDARTENVSAAVLAAESALQAADCGGASQNYLAAAQDTSDVRILQRATEVILDCGQYTLGQRAAERWRSQAPAEAAAHLAVVRSWLGRVRLPEARAQWLGWLNSRPTPSETVVTASISWLEENCGSDNTLAMLREVKHPLMETARPRLRMAELARNAWNYALALTHAEAARAAGAAVDSVDVVRLRALAGLGRAEEALALARSLGGEAPDDNLAVAETLIWLGRDSDAEAELLQRAKQPDLEVLAEQRLAQLQMQRGDYREAEQRFHSLTRVQGTAANAFFNLALITERRGDADEAVRSYEVLAGTEYDAAARNRIAGLYMADGEKSQALRMLSAGDDAGPADLVAAELAQANLLSRHGAAAEGVSRLDAALKNFPGHPEIAYQRAVLLEETDPAAAIASLEAQLRARPADMNLANALGFTLADHNRSLSRAAQLIDSALKTQPDNPAILDSQGWVLFRQGKAQAALPVLQRAYAAFRDGDIGAHLAEVQWSLGRRDEARETLQRALAADPDNRTLAATVARLAPGLQPPKPPAALPAALSDGSGTAI